MQSTTDTEVILHLVARSHRNRFVDRFIEGLRLLEGSYAFVGLTNKKLVGARDPLGIRPLVSASSTAAPSSRRDLRARHHRRAICVENGDVFDEDGAHSHKPFRRGPASSNTSISTADFDRRPQRLRRAQGVRRGAAEAPLRPMWSSRFPIPACRRRSDTRRESGIPYELGIIRNHYVGRTFIEPTQHASSARHSANRAVVTGNASC